MLNDFLAQNMQYNFDEHSFELNINRKKEANAIFYCLVKVNILID